MQVALCSQLSGGLLQHTSMMLLTAKDLPSDLLSLSTTRSETVPSPSRSQPCRVCSRPWHLLPGLKLAAYSTVKV